MGIFTKSTVELSSIWLMQDFSKWRTLLVNSYHGIPFSLLCTHCIVSLLVSSATTKSNSFTLFVRIQAAKLIESLIKEPSSWKKTPWSSGKYAAMTEITELRMRPLLLSLGAHYLLIIIILDECFLYISRSWGWFIQFPMF